MKKILIAALSLSLTACAFKDNGTSTNEEEIRERRKLNEMYKPLVGKYAGRIHTAMGPQDIEINLFILGEEKGRDSVRKVLPMLKASYRRINPVGVTALFNSSYVPETGDLFLTSEIAADKLRSDDIHTITARLLGQRIEGNAASKAGPVGHVDVSFVTTQADVPSVGDENDYNQRLRQEYEKIAGRYQGVVTTPTKQTYNAEIHLAIVGSESSGLPQVIGSFIRSDESSRSLDLVLSVSSYKFEITPAELILTGRPKFGTANYRASFDGSFKEGQFYGTMTSSSRGVEGTFLFKKVEDSPTLEGLQ